jgi:hypothetical protein
MIFLRNLTIYYLKYKYVIIFLERRVFVVFLLFFIKKIDYLILEKYLTYKFIISNIKYKIKKSIKYPKSLIKLSFKNLKNQLKLN